LLYILSFSLFSADQIGDTSTLADPGVVQELIAKHAKAKEHK
jgi:hypothetical protein